MLPRTRLPRTRKGFTLIEAAVAIAIIAILAGAIAPLALKAINQQREFRTRDGLKAAFEAMFGARDRRVANMRSDFGFNPTASLTDLSPMVVNEGGVRAYGADPTRGGMFWGYNGPYWNGATDGANQPLDGWGRPMRLLVAGTSPNQTWQVHSLGANGQDNGGLVDDLVYPTVPSPAVSLKSVLVLNITNSTPATSGAIVIWFRDASGSVTNYTAAQGKISLSSGTTPGGIYIGITRASSTPLSFVLDVQPGEVRSFDVNL